jgi:ABC-type sugar transport system substrate-binding protein
MAASTGSGARARRIGLFVISDRTGYQGLLVEHGRRAAEGLRVEMEVFSADDTAALQSAQIIKFLNAHPDEQLAVIVMPVADIGHEQALDSLARRVLNRGAGWVVLNRDLEAHVTKMRGEFPSLPVSLLAVDNRQIGRIQGRQVKGLLPGGARHVLCVLGNVMTAAARDRQAGFLEAATRAITVSELEGMWSSESAEKVVSRWVTLPAAQEGTLDLVACHNDPMALGARQALHRAARDRNKPEWLRVPVVGVDGLPGEGQRLVDERTLAATVVVPATSGRAVELVVRAWNGGGAMPGKVVLDPRPYPAA